MSFAFALSLGVLFGLGAVGAPIAYAMIIASIAYLLVAGQDLGLVVEQMAQGVLNNFIILAIPLFILSARIMNEGALTDRLLKFCIMILGRFRGGLAHVNVFGSLIFSGMSGSAIADVAGIGRVMMNMMIKTGYSPGFAAAITVASATIGPIFPPSIPMVQYSLVSDASIGYLFLGGIIPAFLMTGFLMLTIAYVAAKKKWRPDRANDEIVTIREIPRVTIQAFPALLLPVILLGGIYGGVATPTEAAAIAAFYALLVATFFYRTISVQKLYVIFFESAHSGALVGLIIAAAYIFNFVVTSANIPQLISTLISNLNLTPLSFMLLANVIFLVLGCFVDATISLLVVIPLFLPSCRAMGIDLVYFGVVIVLNIMIGLTTPPYGILLYVLSGITGVPFSKIVREIWVFIIPLLAVLVVLIIFPDLVLWVPRIFGYKG
ncbi:MAG: TRAP transporter large permease [Deltaproteobacteria bacterium]|nr:TRAP transporter large permease [Deltaproteobacteria bacterium]